MVLEIIYSSRSEWADKTKADPDGRHGRTADRQAQWAACARRPEI